MHASRINTTLSVWLLALALLFGFTACNKGTGNAPDEKPVQDTTQTEATPAKPTLPYTPNRYWNDLARVLGGLAPLEGSTTGKLDSAAAAATHRQFMEKAWEAKETKLLSKVRPWAAEELAAEQKWTGQMFYPFSGPDFFTAHVLYPNAGSYLLIGLEPEGVIPGEKWYSELNTTQLSSDFNNLQKGMGDILGLTFFKTIEMAKDFRRSQFTGTLPLLLAFVARQGQTVEMVEPVIIQADGSLIVDQKPPAKVSYISPDDSIVTGVRIWFRKDTASAPQSVVYFGTNIRNDGLARTPQFEAFLKGLGKGVGFTKSASYLMHNDAYSTVRDFLLANCTTWLQDDTAIPVRFLKNNKYALTLYGNYVRPIPLFASRHQPDLYQLYQSDSSRKELPYSMGYHGPTSPANLQLIRHK